MSPPPLGRLSRSSGTILSWSLFYVASAVLALCYAILVWHPLTGYPLDFGTTFAVTMFLLLTLVVAIVAFEGIAVEVWLSLRLLERGETRAGVIALLPVILGASLLVLAWTVAGFRPQMQVLAHRSLSFAAGIEVAACAFVAICFFVTAWALRRTRVQFEEDDGFVLFDSVVTLIIAALMLVGWIVLVSWGMDVRLSAGWWFAIAVVGVPTLGSSTAACRSIQPFRLAVRANR